MAQWVQFSFKYLLFPDKLFSWCVWWLWAATAVDKVLRKVLSSLCCWKIPWHGERRTCKANLLYILYIWWPLTTKGTHYVRYVNEQPLWERQKRCTWEKYYFKVYLWVSMSTIIYKWELLVQIRSCMRKNSLPTTFSSWLVVRGVNLHVGCFETSLFSLEKKIKENTPNLQSIKGWYT